MKLLRLLSLLLTLLPGLAGAVTCTATIPPSNPDSIYTDHGDGTVTDTRTGLMWKRCAEGQTWDGSTCTGSATTHTWQAALAQAEGASFAGHADWRLPNLKELRSLVEECRRAPAINDSVFPNAWASSSYFWSGSPHANGSSSAWVVDSNDGVAAYGGDGYSVRLVRGGQSFASFDLSTPTADTTPDAFSFTARTGVALSTPVDSDAITVAGIDAAAPIAVSGGIYRIGDGDWTGEPGAVNNGQTVQVRVTSASAAGQQASATLSIGGVPATFTVTTATATPAAFSFDPVSGAAKGASVTSGAVTIAGLAGESGAIGVVGGAYRIDGGDWTSTPGVVVDGNVVEVRVNAAAGAYAMTTAVLTIGGASATFAVTTAEDAVLVPVWPASPAVKSVAMQGGKAVRYYRLLSVDGHTPLANRKIKYAVNGTPIVTGGEAEAVTTDGDGVFGIETDWLVDTPTGPVGLPMEVHLFYDTAGVWDGVADIAFPVRITRRSMRQSGSVDLGASVTSGVGLQAGVRLKAGGRGLRAVAALNKIDFSAGAKAGFSFASTSRRYDDSYTDSQAWYPANGVNETVKYPYATANHLELDYLTFREHLGLQGDVGVGSEAGLAFSVAPYRQVAVSATGGVELSIAGDAATEYTFPTFFDSAGGGGCHIAMRALAYASTGAPDALRQLRDSGIGYMCGSPLAGFRDRKAFSTTVAAHAEAGVSFSTGDVTGGRNRGYGGDFGKSFAFAGFSGDLALTHTHADEYDGQPGVSLVRAREVDEVEVEASFTLGAGIGANLTGAARDRERSLKSGESFASIGGGAYGRLGRRYEYDLSGNLQTLQRTLSVGYIDSAEFATVTGSDLPRVDLTVFTLDPADAQRHGKGLGELGDMVVNLDDEKAWIDNALAGTDPEDFSGPVGFFLERSEVTKTAFDIEVGAALGAKLEFGTSAEVILENRSIQQVGLTTAVTAADGSLSRRKFIIELYRPDAYSSAVQRNLLAAVQAEVAASLSRAMGKVVPVYVPPTDIPPYTPPPPAPPTQIQVPANGSATLTSNRQVVTQPGSTVVIPDTSALGAQIALPTLSPNASAQPVSLTLGGQTLLVTGASEGAVLSVRSIEIDGVSQPVLAVTGGSVTFAQLPASSPIVSVGSGIVTSGTDATAVQVSYSASAGQTIIAVSNGVVLLPRSQSVRTQIAGLRSAPVGISLYAGEVVRMSDDGAIVDMRLGSAERNAGLAGDPLTLDLPASLAIATTVPRLTAPAARLGGPVQAAIAAAVGGTLAVGQTGGVLAVDLEGTRLYLLPLGEVGIDPQRPDGVTLNPDGTATVSASGIGVRLAASLPSLARFAADLAQALPGVQLTVQANGVLVATLGDAAYAVRVDWIGVPASQDGFTADPASQLAHAQDGQARTLHPAFADFARLVAAVEQAVPGATVQTNGDGTVTVSQGEARLILTPAMELKTAPPGEALWWVGDDGRLRLRNGDGTVQGFGVE